MKLNAYMDLKGLSDAEFAEQLGVSRSTISRLRRMGETNQLPSRQTMEAIARATDGAVTANDFWLHAA